MAVAEAGLGEVRRLGQELVREGDEGEGKTRRRRRPRRVDPLGRTGWGSGCGEASHGVAEVAGAAARRDSRVRRGGMRGGSDGEGEAARAGGGALVEL